jgi:hypothetical protein
VLFLSSSTSSLISILQPFLHHLLHLFHFLHPTNAITTTIIIIIITTTTTTTAVIYSSHPLCSRSDSRVFWRYRSFIVGFPLTLIGGIAGKRLATPFYAPVRTKNFPREIPPIPWYRQLPYQMLIAGFLPFRFFSLSLLFFSSML